VILLRRGEWELENQFIERTVVSCSSGRIVIGSGNLKESTEMGMLPPVDDRTLLRKGISLAGLPERVGW
jgi:hypothetical protein